MLAKAVRPPRLLNQGKVNQSTEVLAGIIGYFVIDQVVFSDGSLRE